MEFGSRIRQVDSSAGGNAGNNVADSGNSTDAVASSDSADASSDAATENGTQPDAGGLDLIAIVGIVALAAAVILLAGILIVLLRRS